MILWKTPPCPRTISRGAGSADNITITTGWQGSRERCTPNCVGIVDRDESEGTYIAALTNIIVARLRKALYCLPLPNAICSDWGETQSFNAAEPTLFLNPTMPETATQRCWQIHPSVPPVPLHSPVPVNKYIQTVDHKFKKLILTTVRRSIISCGKFVTGQDCD